MFLLNEEICEENGWSKPKGVRKEIESYLKERYPDIVKKYGLKNGKELPNVLAKRIIHELFCGCAGNAYLYWLEENLDDIVASRPFAYNDIDRAFVELEKQYAKNKVDLDAEAWVHELKLGLNYVLLDNAHTLRNIVMSDDYILDIQLKGALPTEEVAQRLKEEMVKAKELSRQVWELYQGLQKLVRDTEGN